MARIPLHLHLQRAHVVLWRGKTKGISVSQDLRFLPTPSASICRNLAVWMKRHRNSSPCQQIQDWLPTPSASKPWGVLEDSLSCHYVLSISAAGELDPSRGKQASCLFRLSVFQYSNISIYVSISGCFVFQGFRRCQLPSVVV